jgi:1,4-alpha-glucan branching enzyme
MPNGYVALIVELHHPLPGLGQGVGRDWPHAAATTYWPLLRTLVGAADRGLSDVATLAVSPSWNALADDSNARALARSELERRLAEADRQSSSSAWADHWRGLWAFAGERFDFDMSAALRRAGQSAALEMIPTTSSAAWLPAFADLPIVSRAQVSLAAADHARVFGNRPQGIWLPHLAYRPGLEETIAAAGLRFFTVDADALCRGTVQSPAGPFGILVTPPGTAAFGCDASLVGNLTSGGVHYRLDPRYADPFTAQAAIVDHVDHFLAGWYARIERGHAGNRMPPVSLIAISAHDIGGWWPLGALWLERLLFCMSDVNRWMPTTPSRYLDRYPEGPVGLPGPSAGGLLSVRPAGSDLTDHCRSAAATLEDVVGRLDALDPMARRAAAQMTRLLLRAQALDWHLPPEFPCEDGLARAMGCLARFNELAGLLAAAQLDPERLAFYEAQRPVYLPEIELERLAEG